MENPEFPLKPEERATKPAIDVGPMCALILLLLLLPVRANPQKLITLSECYEKAYAVSKIGAEKSIYPGIWALQDKNLRRMWLPTLDANGSFVYNSSVIDIGSVLGGLPIPGIAGAIKPLPNEQYKVTVDINQTIWDGGAVKGARALAKADLDVSEQQTETDLYKLRSQVNGYFFNILLLTNQKELLRDYLNVIVRRIASLKSALANGMILQSDIDVMTSEQIRINQQLNENDVKRLAFSKMLALITGMEIDTSAILVTPAAANNQSMSLARPELALFDLRRDQLSAGLLVVGSKRMPKAFGFATFGYGNPPGSNFFKNQFAPYYILGAGFKWNIYDWNKTRNEKQVIGLQQSIIDNRKTDFEENISRQLDAKNAEIVSLESLVASDTELITLKKRITAASESQYENGTITATEFMNVMNSEQQAVINAEIHKISLEMAKVEFLNISGNEIE
ncbi:MAG: TolC family protein [Bacteroidales bacterium]